MRLTGFTAGLCVALPITALGYAPTTEDLHAPLPVATTYCFPGEHCTSCDSEMPLAHVNEALNVDLKNGEVLLFTPNPEQPESMDWQWRASGKYFPWVVEVEQSGTGIRDQSLACADMAPLRGSHQPKDGYWSVVPSAHAVENCRHGPLPANPASREKMKFDRPFRGRLNGEESLAKIVQTSPNSFIGRDDIGTHIGESLMVVHSPEAMTVYYLMRSTNAADACTIRFGVDMTYDGEG